MKRALSTVLVVVMLLSAVPLLSGCVHRPKNWYKEVLDYYSEGVQTGWTNEKTSLNVYPSGDMKKKDPSKKFGYLLVDLDKDGVDELLIGFNDGSTATKFTDVIVYHSDLGPYKLLGGDDGYYIYLCSNNVLAVDSWYGSQTNRDFMTWDSKTNSFPHVDGEGKYLPKKWDLKEF